MMTHEEYMKEALKLAEISASEGEVPVGAVVVCEGEIVGTGRNRRETEKNALCHAEVTNLFELEFNHKPVYEKGILETECSGILTRFFKNLREKKAGN